MSEKTIAASRISAATHKLMSAYMCVLQPVCEDTGMPPLAADIMLFIYNNPQFAAAKDICSVCGFKPGIVSFHVDKLVNEGLLTREEDVSDRRKTKLLLTEKAIPVVEKGRALQAVFEKRILDGLSEQDKMQFVRCMKHIIGNIDAIAKEHTHARRKND